MDSAKGQRSQGPDYPDRDRAEHNDRPDIKATEEWWAETSDGDCGHALKKASIYGSADLEVMGRAMEVLIYGGTAESTAEKKAVGMEAACAFYALGKVSRLFSHYKAGESGDDDSWEDLTIYSTMARRIRDSGRWP